MRLNDSDFVVFGPDPHGPAGFIIIPATPASAVASPKVAVEATFTQSVNPNVMSVVCRKNGATVPGAVSLSPTVSATVFLISVALSGVSVGDVINVTVSAPVSHSVNCTAS